MDRNTPTGRLHNAICVLLLTATHNPERALLACKTCAARESIPVSDDELKHAIRFVRAHASNLLAGMPLADTPSNSVLSRMAPGGVR